MIETKIKKYKFAFVILHYNTIEETEVCISSILQNIKEENIFLVIVDNNSPNKTGEILQEKYKTLTNITVIINNTNLGFAKGNNIGFNYAKYQLKADFIALINNDTFIKQSDFIKKIYEKFAENKFHILGPDIVSTKNNKHQNPRKLTLQDKDVLKKNLRLYYVLLILNYFYIDKIVENIKKKFIKKSIVHIETEIKIDWKQEQENVKLHGSALIFSPLYIKLYEGLNPDTFMYSEEAILYFIAQRDKLKMLYFPSIQILHNEDISTNSIYNTNIYKRRFYYKNFIKSGKVLLKLMNNK
ncbi:MAG: glycosyl transferase family 2 [Ignavibacteriae bacterium]|nr:MAG: glycosyl transferase family 2 [Ignavibacteriota bacterium]